MRYLTVVILVVLSSVARAQDLIVLFPNDSIEVKITNVEGEKVHFLGDVGTSDEQAYTLHKSDIKHYIIGFYSRFKLANIPELTFTNPIETFPEYVEEESPPKKWGINFHISSAHIPYVEDTYFTTYFIGELKSGTMVGTGVDYFFSSKIGVGIDINRYTSKIPELKAKMGITFIGPELIFNTYWRDGAMGLSLRGSIGYFNYYLRHDEYFPSALRGDGMGVKFDPAFHILLFSKVYLKLGTPIYAVNIENLKDRDGVLYDDSDITDISRIDFLIGIHAKF
jgi:hypothetical protein